MMPSKEELLTLSVEQLVEIALLSEEVNQISKQVAEGDSKIIDLQKEFIDGQKVIIQALQEQVYYLESEKAL